MELKRQETFQVDKEVTMKFDVACFSFACPRLSFWDGGVPVMHLSGFLFIDINQQTHSKRYNKSGHKERDIHTARENIDESQENWVTTKN